MVHLLADREQLMALIDEKDKELKGKVQSFKYISGMCLKRTIFSYRQSLLILPF